MLFTVAAALAAFGCGKDGGTGPTDPPPSGDPPSSENPPPSEDPPAFPAPQGMVVYALDNGNRLLMFGTESAETPSRIVGISGLPILKRIIGIDFRPSNGKLYGVGNDSRVYVIDTLTGAATPVGSGPFSPAIVSSFDIHFGMGFQPSTDRIRLISTELGMNWSINPDDGTAIVGKALKFAAGDPNEGETPHIAGLAYGPPTLSPPSSVLGLSLARLAGSDPCSELLWAMDTRLAQFVGSCGDDDLTTLGPIEGIDILACAELKFDHGPGNLWVAAQRGADALNSIGTVTPNGIDWHIKVPNNWLIQSITFKPTPDALPPAPSVGVGPGGLSLSVASHSDSGAVPPLDPVAQCRGTAGQ
jgi:hypothetical protein